MKQGRDIVSTKETITSAAVTECNCRPVPGGTVVLSFKLSVGKVGILKREMFTNEAIAALPIRDERRLDTRYLLNALGTLDFRGIGERAVKGITLNTTSLAQLQIPVPSLEEQRQVTSLLDMADTIRRKRTASLDMFGEFLQSLFLEMFGDPVTNERGWDKKALGDICEVNRGRFTPRPRNDPRYYGGEFPFVQTGDIAGASGWLTTWRQTLNENGARVSRRFPRGTIATTIAANIGDTAIVDFDFYCPDSVVGIITKPIVDAGFLEVCLRFLKPILAARAPMTAQRNINLGVLRPLRIPIPPLELQKQFSEIRQASARIRDRLDAGRRDSEVLTTSIAQRLFGKR